MTNKDTKETKKLLKQLDDDIVNAIYSKLDSLKNKDVIGTVELFRIIKNIKPGPAKRFFYFIDNDIFSEATLQREEQEYNSIADNIPFTTSAVEALEYAHKLAIETYEPYPGSGHLLLGLFNNKDSSVISYLKRDGIDIDGCIKELHSTLGIGERVSIRVRAYELCSKIECDLNESIICIMKNVYGPNWWNERIAENIKNKCEDRCKMDGYNLNPETYIDLKDYAQIIKDEWYTFGEAMEHATRIKGREESVKWLNSVNLIRRAVMHPIRRSIYPDDIYKLEEAKVVSDRFAENLMEN